VPFNTGLNFSTGCAINPNRCGPFKGHPSDHQRREQNLAATRDFQNVILDKFKTITAMT
jgi:hypothetical protein